MARKSQYPWWARYIKSRATEVWGWDPNRKAAKSRAGAGRDDRGNDLFRCEKCGKEPLRRAEVEVDHIVPRVDPHGWTTWDDYFERTFVAADGLQILCKECHRPKSESENKVRRAARKLATK